MRMEKPVNVDSTVVPKGKYHFEILKVEETTSRGGDPATKYSLRVQAYEKTQKEDLANRVFTETVNHYVKDFDDLSHQNQSRICQLAIAARVPLNNGDEATKESIDAAIAADEDIVFDWDKATGKHILAEVDERPNKDKTQVYRELKFGHIFAIDDHRAKGWPKDERAASLATAGDVF